MREALFDDVVPDGAPVDEATPFWDWGALGRGVGSEAGSGSGSGSGPARARTSWAKSES